MSPEQCLGFEVDHRSDIYSLGCLMYEAISGNAPFAGKNAVQIISKHLAAEPFALESNNDRLNDLVVSCLAKEVSDRPQSVDMLLLQIRRIEQGSNHMPIFFNFRKKIKNLLKSKNKEILPGARFLYGSVGMPMRFYFILCILTFLPSAKTFLINPFCHLLCAVGLFSACFFLSKYRARIRHVSQIVETSKSTLAEIESVRKNWLSGYNLTFKDRRKREDYFADGVSFESLSLPVACEAWVDKEGRRIAVQVENTVLLREIEGYAITHIGWWKIPLALALTGVSVLPKAGPAECDLINYVVSMSAAVLILGGLVRGLLRRDRLQTTVCAISLPFCFMLISLLIIQLFHISRPGGPISLPNWIPYPAEVFATVNMAAWSLLALVRLSEYTGLLKLRKPQAITRSKKPLSIITKSD